MFSSFTYSARNAPSTRDKWAAVVIVLGCALAGSAGGAETFIVNDASDEGDGICDVLECTLREAVAAAENEDAHPGADIVEVAPGIDPVLTQAAEITIATEVKIAGQGADETTISADENGRIFFIDATGDVVLEDVTMTGGTAPDGSAGAPGAPGGAIVNLGTLEIADCILSENHAGDGGEEDENGNGGDGGGGGAIVNAGSLTVTGSTLSGNRAGDGTEPSFGDSGGDGGDGGAILNSGILIVADTMLSENRAGNGGDPAFGDYGGAGGEGGAIANSGTLDVNNSQLSANEAGDGGGSVDICPGFAGRGGAIFNSGDLTIALSILTKNLAGDGGDGGSCGDDGAGGDGGAIFNSGALELATSTLSANQAGEGGRGLGADKGGNGGAISNVGDVAIMSSTLSNNRAGGGGDAELGNEVAAAIGGFAGDGGDGGAIDNAGTLTLVNSTLFANMAGFGGSAESPPLDGVAGAIYNRSSAVSTIDASTIAGNSAPRASGGIYLADIDGSLILTNTLVAENLNLEDGFPTNCSADDPADLVDGGGNLDDGATCGFSADSLSNTAAGLDPKGLGDHGGPTESIALLLGSSAIDRADDDSCPERDQRGVLRGTDAVGDGSDDDLDGGCDIGAFEFGLVSTALEVDPEPGDSDGNGVFEPEELVVVAPAWQNGTASSLTLAGTASDFSGPAGPSYEIHQENATYGEVGPAEVTSCRDTGMCYQMEVAPEGVDRPAVHWEATFEETLVDGAGMRWVLHIGDSFTDVPRSHLFYTGIETLLHSGVTGGCGDGSTYCPADANTRSQMPAFMLRALMGPDYTPPACDEGEERLFDDVPALNLFCPWIEDLAKRGIVSGCGGDNYCPSDSVTRAQMAIFLLRTLEGPDYTPDACSGRFDDVPCPSLFADWIEDLAGRGITSGCTETEYCPTDVVARGQMAAFITNTWSFTIYGP